MTTLSTHVPPDRQSHIHNPQTHKRHSSMLVDGSGASTDDAGTFLREALEATFARAVGLWARHTVRPLGE